MFYIFISILILIIVFIKRKWIMNLFKPKTIENKQGVIENPIENAIENKPNTVFAINDNGNFDLMDENGKILNIGFGPNPKVYINLLDQSEKDTDKLETEHGVQFIRKVDTKIYEIGGRPYTVNFTKL